MPARIPLDVDLEDKLLYGLTPTRLAYLVIALLAAFSTWSSPWASAPIRAGVAVALVGVQAFQLVNGGLLTTLLTHGWALAIIVLWAFPFPRTTPDGS